MKSCVKSFGFLALLAFACGSVGQASAQAFKTLHSFNARDGANPFAGLVLSSNILYGTSLSGGPYYLDTGTVFALNTDGTGFRTVYQFPDWQWLSYTNSDGVHPRAGLTLSGDTLYGTAQAGGSAANGAVFAVKTDGTAFTNLHSFTASSGDLYTNADGANPIAGLILSGDTLYGAAPFGGNSGNGTLFAMNTQGKPFAVLHAFTVCSTNSLGTYTNWDGANPWGGLILSGNTLYGTAQAGGSSGSGTLFAIHTDGTGFTVLHAFTAESDGANPVTGLALSGNTLYGTAAFGGNSGSGTIFSVRTDGTGFATLHQFTTLSYPNPYPGCTNSDGANPQSEMIISGTRMFGSARLGGKSGHGAVFAINTDGTDFATVYDFTAPALGIPHTNADGYFPSGGLVLSGNVLYGTARSGGSYSGNGDPDANGTIFSISLPVRAPPLSVNASGGSLVLTWPTNFAGLDAGACILQSTTNLASPVWITNLPTPVVINGQYKLSNPISGTRQFFRLSQ